MEPLDPDLFRPPPHLTGPEVAARVGLPYDYVRSIFRALGFAEVAEDAVEFDDRDVEVLETLRLILSQGYSETDVLTVARTYGYGLSRVAHAEVRLFRRTFIDRLRHEATDEDEVVEELRRIVPPLVELLGKQVAHVHRRHLAVALQQVTSSELHGDAEVATIGFVDLVGFSRLTNDLEADDLGGLVSRFESLALETSVDHGATVVKMIGDAVMIAAPGPGAAVRAALGIVTEADSHEELPAARAGLDLGEVTAVGGDFFGSPVNVAARLTGFARPGTVVASAAVIDALDEAVDASHVGKTRLKGVGSVRAFKVNAYPAASAP